MALGRSPPPQAPQHADIRTVNMDERKAISVLLEMGTGQAPAPADLGSCDPVAVQRADNRVDQRAQAAAAARAALPRALTSARSRAGAPSGRAGACDCTIGRQGQTGIRKRRRCLCSLRRALCGGDGPEEAAPVVAPQPMRPPVAPVVVATAVRPMMARPVLAPHHRRAPYCGMSGKVPPPMASCYAYAPTLPAYYA